MDKVKFGTKIKLRRKVCGLRQWQIAHALGVTRATVAQWELGNNFPRGKTLEQLAKLLRVSVDWLMHLDSAQFSNIGDEFINVPLTEKKLLSYSTTPLLLWQDVAEYVNNPENFDEKKIKRRLPCIEIMGPNSFCVEMKGDSMTCPAAFNSIYEHTILAIDPTSEWRPGDFLAVLVSEILTIKKLAQEGPKFYLMSLNPTYNPIQLRLSSCKIIGPVIYGVINYNQAR